MDMIPDTFILVLKPCLAPGPHQYTHYYVQKPELLPHEITISDGPTFEIRRHDDDESEIEFFTSHISSSKLLHSLLHHELVFAFNAENMSPNALALILPVIESANRSYYPEKTWSRMSNLAVLSLGVDVGAIYGEKDSESTDDRALLALNTMSSSLHDMLDALSPQLLDLDIGFHVAGGFKKQYRAEFGRTLPDVRFPWLEQLAFAGFADFTGQFTTFLENLSNLRSIALGDVNMGSQSLLNIFKTLKNMNLSSITLVGSLVGCNGEETIDFNASPCLSEEFEKRAKEQDLKGFEKWCKYIITDPQFVDT